MSQISNIMVWPATQIYQLPAETCS